MTEFRIKSHLPDIFRFRAGEESRYPYLRLDKNERGDGYPEGLIREIRDRISVDTINVYPEPEPLYIRLAEQSGLKKENFVLTTGADGAIKAAFEICDFARGASVIRLEPTFAMVDIYCQIFGVHAKIVQYVARNQAPPEIEVDQILNALDDSVSLVVLANPNSPTGTLISREDILKIVKAAAAFGSLVLVDETYFDFSGASVIDQVEEHSNLIVARSFSKGLGLAGLRIGYLAASKRTARACFAIKPMYEVNSISLLFAEALLERPECVGDYVRAIDESRGLIQKLAASVGVGFLNSQANFVYLETGEQTGRILEDAQAAGVLVRAGMGSAGYADWLRISLIPARSMEPFMKILRARLGKEV